MITISVPEKTCEHAGALSVLRNICSVRAAWQALDGNCRALYVELARRYRGPNSNNGKIPYSVREAARALPIGRSTAQRCFERLMFHGFIRISKRSGFSMKGRVSTEWLLTEFPDDTRSNFTAASKDFHEMDA